MSLDTVAQLGRTELEKQINPSLKVKLRTLTAIEYTQVMKSGGSSGLSTTQGHTDLSTLGQLAGLQIDTLAFATISVNGETATAEAFRKMYQNMQYPVLLDVYGLYMEVLEGQNKVLDELKKNSQNNQSLEKTT
jgi:hypothetical protein